MDIRELEYFVEVAETSSFRQAAENLFTSTPAVSSGLRRLESRLGVKLFVRSSRSVALTPEGEDLLGEARAILESIGAIRHHASALAGRVRLTAGTFWGLGASWLTDGAASLHAAGHDIVVDVRVFGWDDPTGGLRTRQADIAIIPGPSEIDSSLRRLRLANLGRVAILPERLPLAHRPSVTVDDLDGVGWVRFPAVDPVAHRWWRLDDVRGGPPPERGRVHDTPHELMIAIRDGFGTCTTVEAFTEQFSFSGLRLVPVIDAPPVPVDLAYRLDRPQRTAHALAAAIVDRTASRL
jgi:DNA-binding transcriptional LysR family regulator